MKKGLSAAMKVAVFGASGFVGGYLLKTFRHLQAESIGTFFQHPEKELVHLDCSDKQAVRSFVCNNNFDNIVVLAAQPNVEWCESHQEESYVRNTLPMCNLADIISSMSPTARPRVIFISSDYVFDGLNGPYTEEALPNPLNVYGRHKLEAENITLALQGTVARITVVYGLEKHQKNFAERLMHELQNKHEVRVPIDQIGSPTYVEDVAYALAELAIQGLQGIYHLAGPECISRYQFALNIAKVMQLDPAYVIPVTTSKLAQEAQRPLRAGMLSTKFENIVNWKFQGVNSGLLQMKGKKDRNAKG